MTKIMKDKTHSWQKFLLLLLFSSLLPSCRETPVSDSELPPSAVDTLSLMLDLNQAERLAELPLHCLQKQFPYKLGQTLGSASDLATPIELHPAFYGCFDWHSAVHGHWSLVALLQDFPNLENAGLIKEKLQQNLTYENIQQEVTYFNGHHNRNFERTYGWTWLLKLALELKHWEDPMGQALYKQMQPLCELLVEKYMTYLPKLQYPIRVGTHANTAFGLTFAYDYADAMGHDSLRAIIEDRCRHFYKLDQNCPITWEPSGADFLSPCLEEIDIMRRILPRGEFLHWLKDFMPQLFNQSYELSPGIVGDREDGQLVHLDGVNFSRAWCLYYLANNFQELSHLRAIADQHVASSLPSLTNDHYEGSHWLASFAILALQGRNGNVPNL